MKRHEPRRIAFACAAFHRDLAAIAKTRGMSMWQVAQEVGVNEGAISKYRYRPPDGVSLAALSRWSGLDAAAYSIDLEQPA